MAMEVSNVQPFAKYDNTMQADMDFDMDIDMEVDPEIARLEAESMRVDEQHEAFLQQQNSLFQDAPNPTDIVPEKVNIQGLDNLTTNDVRSFISEYDSTDNFLRLEWINDTSANMVFRSAEAALQALNTFTSSGITEWSITTIPASGIRTKPLSSHPKADLRVRLATVRDVKQRGAREASRFYLMNPEHDPAEKRRNDRGRGGRRDDRSRDSRGEYKRLPFDDQEHRRRQNGDTFNADMYDDDAGSGTRNGSRRRDDGSRMRHGSTYIRRDSFSSRDMDTSGDDSGRKRVHFRPRQDNFGRLRDRSASPGPDGDGRMGFEEDENSVRRRIRQRSQTPPSYRRERRDNHAKELFSVKSSASSVLSSSSNGRDLFANRSSSPRREILPPKTPSSGHRRSDAIDASEDGPELFGKSRSLADRITPRSLADRITPRGDLASRITTRDLADRITPKNDSYGRLKDNDGEPTEGINIRGSAEQLPGFSIRGAAANEGTELFKDRELFSAKIKGRGGPRRRAEDLFN